MRRGSVHLSCLLLLTLGIIAPAWSQENPFQQRMDADARAGHPLVAHVVVALCDNENQGILPVPKALGNGQDPKSNLYWGALYGVPTYLKGKGGWEKMKFEGAPPEGVLERVVFRKRMRRPGPVDATAYVVADAWDGARMRDAIDAFFRMTGGHNPVSVKVKSASRTLEIAAGGSSHVVVFVGHDGLMEMPVPPQPPPVKDAPARSAMVFACTSRDFFGPTLKQTGAHRLLMTTGFMAPEAYSVDAALKQWFAGGTAAESREAAAQTYQKYQNCGLKGARGLFTGE